MKQIINKVQKPVIEQVYLADMPPTNLQRSVFVLKMKDKIYLLVEEEKSFIFRDVNAVNAVGARDFAGLNGRHPIMEFAIKVSLEYGEVFQCDSYAEASKLFNE